MKKKTQSNFPNHSTIYICTHTAPNFYGLKFCDFRESVTKFFNHVRFTIHMIIMLFIHKNLFITDACLLQIHLFITDVHNVHARLEVHINLTLDSVGTTEQPRNANL